MIHPKTCSDINIQREQNELENILVREERKRHKKEHAILGLSCHPYAGAMLIFSVWFQFFQMPRVMLGETRQDGENYR